MDQKCLEDQVKEYLIYGTVRSSEGSKITKELTMHDPEYEALVVVYVELPDRFKIISNHLRRRK